MAVAYTPGNEPLPSYGQYNGTGNGPGPGASANTQIAQPQPPIVFAYPASSTQHHPP